MIKEKDGYKLYSPMNTYDVNYHLLDEQGNDYLIDSGDVGEIEQDVEDYAIILWQDLKELFDIEYIKSIAWKVTKVNDTLGLRSTLDKITIL